MPTKIEIPESDPLAVFTRPPPNESPEERYVREAREAEEKRVSDGIDDELRKEKMAIKRKKNPVSVLLLGQSESGKSTTLKNFQMAYAPSAWKRERMSWRAVIQLNLVRAINVVLNALQSEFSGEPLAADDDDTESAAPLPFTDRHQILKLRLTPLRHVEADLRTFLGEKSDEEGSTTLPRSYSSDSSDGETSTTTTTRRPQEFFVRSWKNVLEKNSGSGQTKIAIEHADDATEVITGCKDDIKALWEDPIVREFLHRRRVTLGDSAAFYLNNVSRIASRGYEPSDDDIVRARLRTLGVQEHRLRFEQGSESGTEWTIYDVGGARSARTAWLPYFDNVNAIIFLAPISCFDERLAEDPRVNRLRDSFLLWRAICSSQLLSKTTMIIFLNKCDILQKKLEMGVRVSEFLPSYGERPNDRNSVIKYLSKKFQDTLRENSPIPRMCYLYPTSVTDTDSTVVTLDSVRDGIVREYLSKANLV